MGFNMLRIKGQDTQKKKGSKFLHLQRADWSVIRASNQSHLSAPLCNHTNTKDHKGTEKGPEIAALTPLLKTPATACFMT